MASLSQTRNSNLSCFQVIIENPDALELVCSIWGLADMKAFGDSLVTK